MVSYPYCTIGVSSSSSSPSNTCNLKRSNFHFDDPADDHFSLPSTNSSTTTSYHNVHPAKRSRLIQTFQDLSISSSSINDNDNDIDIEDDDDNTTLQLNPAYKAKPLINTSSTSSDLLYPFLKTISPYLHFYERPSLALILFQQDYCRQLVWSTFLSAWYRYHENDNKMMLDSEVQPIQQLDDDDAMDLDD